MSEEDNSNLVFCAFDPSSCNEDALYLNLPEMAEGARFATVSEVYIILKERNTNKRPKFPAEMQKLFEYYEKVAKFKTERFLNDATRLIATTFNVHPYELTMLINLVPTSAEEAKNLIPTIEEKIEDDKLEALLKRLKELHESDMGVIKSQENK
ncbi:hypothetical protein ACOME3_003853 [Neoechinorhynchus agilis]